MLLNKIRKLCDARGISIFRLERDLKFGNGTVRGWSCSSPSADKLKRVADYFGVTVDELLREDAADQAG